VAHERRAADDLHAIRSFIYRMNGVFKKTAPLSHARDRSHQRARFWERGASCLHLRLPLHALDKGFFCFPEVDVSIPFLPGMIALPERPFQRYKYQEMVYAGKRYTASELGKQHQHHQKGLQRSG